MNTFEKAHEVFSEMSDELLIHFHRLITQPIIPHVGLVPKVITDIFGKVDIIHLQIQQVLGALLDVITERFVFYSQQYNPQL